MRQSVSENPKITWAYSNVAEFGLFLWTVAGVSSELRLLAGAGTVPVPTATR